MKPFSQFISEAKEPKGDDKAYERYFEKMLKKWGVDSPEEIPDDKKDEFFDAVDAGWESDKEEKETD